MHRRALYVALLVGGGVAAVYAACVAICISSDAIDDWLAQQEEKDRRYRAR